MASRWPVAQAAAAVANAFALARCIGGGSCCQCFRIALLNMQWQAAADAFVLPCCIASCSCYHCFGVVPQHGQLQQLPLPSCWPLAYTIAAAADVFTLDNAQFQLLPMA